MYLSPWTISEGEINFKNMFAINENLKGNEQKLPMQVRPQKLYQESKMLKRQPSRYLYWEQEQTLETKMIIQGHLPNQDQPENGGQLIIYS